MALVGAYRRQCAELRLKPNKRFEASLPADGDGLEEMDLSDNLVGGAGLAALVEVVRLAPNLKYIGLRSNNLTAASVGVLVEALKRATSIRRLDLSDNDIRLAGPLLLELVRTNKGIQQMDLADTFVRPMFSRLIASQLRKNVQLAERGTAQSAQSSLRGPSSSCLRRSPEERPPSAGKKQVEFGAKVVVDQVSPSASPQSASPQAAADQGPGLEVIPVELRRYSAFDDDGDGSPGGDASPAFGQFKQPFQAEPQQTEEQKGLQQKLDSFSFGSHSPQKDKSGAVQKRPDSGGMLELKPVATRRPTVCAEVFTKEQIETFHPEVVAKDSQDRAFLLMVLERNPMFSHLDDRELMVAVDAMHPCVKARGDCVYEQGDECYELFFILTAGEVTVLVDGDHVRTIKRGDWFAEMALLYPQPAIETARAERDCTLFSLDRVTYKFILSQASQKRRAVYGGFLRKVPFLQSLSEAELLQLADALKSSAYEDNVPLIKYGEEGTWLHIVVEGDVAVIGRSPEGKKLKVCEFTKGDCVGELEFINNHTTVADVVAIGKVRTAKMNRRHFEMCMGPVVDLLRKNADSLEKFAYYRDTLSRLRTS